MVAPLIVWGGVAVAGLIAGGWAADQAGDAAEQAGNAAQKTAGLAKWAVIGGGLYVSYRALKSAGALK